MTRSKPKALLVGSVVIMMLLFSLMEKSGPDYPKSFDFSDYDVHIIFPSLSMNRESFMLLEEDKKILSDIFVNNYLEIGPKKAVYDHHSVVFEMENQTSLETYMWVIHTNTKQNYLAGLSKNKVHYICDLSDEALEIIKEMNKKYLLVAAGTSSSKHIEVSLGYQEEKESYRVNDYKIHYDDVVLTEVFMTTKHNYKHLSMKYFEESDWLDGMISLAIQVDEPVEELSLIARGYEIINGEKRLFQEIHSLEY
ncbi:hypothetical protein EZV73_21200 [Acidaminobacter sp. JC074]|uniref:hypothetical protein n=1 Tax=Acidaminobacter sp. JC074 TaxID=2530199 RepID=UPI001F0E0070|nr:hypothetical protein [Acidaminobacter sp. JC074]MCH4890111.1 hypothetical protein [Acidaminobacter sp. JC074]